jgi:hypothetical protein
MVGGFLVALWGISPGGFCDTDGVGSPRVGSRGQVGRPSIGIGAGDESLGVSPLNDPKRDKGQRGVAFGCFLAVAPA